MAAEPEIRAWRVEDEQGCCLIYAKSRSAAKWLGAQKLGRDFKGLTARRWQAWDWGKGDARLNVGVLADPKNDYQLVFPEPPVKEYESKWWRVLWAWAVQMGRASQEQAQERAG